jgi:hypothetical protein
LKNGKQREYIKREEIRPKKEWKLTQISPIIARYVRTVNKIEDTKLTFNFRLMMNIFVSISMGCAIM